MQEFIAGGNIAHRRAIMHIPDIPLHIHDAHQRQATLFEQVHLLTIHTRHTMIRIGQSHERNLLIVPKSFERFSIVWTHSNDLSLARYKARILIPQARQRRAAVRSHKPAQEVQHDGFVAAKIQEADALPGHIGEFEIRRKFAG